MRYKGDKSIGQVKEKEVSIIGTTGEAFEHTKRSKHLSVTRYYFLRKGVDPNGAQSGEKAIIQQVPTRAADKKTQDVYQSLSNTSISRHGSELASRSFVVESHVRIIATIPDIVFTNDATDNSCSPRTLVAIANVSSVL
jgi:hypothetical protein